MQVIEARLAFAIDLAEHRRNAEGNRLDDFDGMASPGAVSGMELQACAVDFVAMEEQAREGVGGVEEWTGTEDAIVIGHELAPILRVKAQHVDPVAALEVVGVILRDDVTHGNISSLEGACGRGRRRRRACR